MGIVSAVVAAFANVSIPFLILAVHEDLKPWNGTKERNRPTRQCLSISVLLCIS